MPDTQVFDIEPAAATHLGMLYRFPFGALACVTLAVNFGGMARGFLCLVTPLVLERPVGPARQPLGARLQVRAQLQAGCRANSGTSSSAKSPAVTGRGRGGRLASVGPTLELTRGLRLVVYQHRSVSLGNP